jgi:hypothetical protein
MLQFVVRFPSGFKDLSVLPRYYKRGEQEVIEGEAKFNQVRQSQPDIEVLERRLPINKKRIPAKRKTNAK